MDKSMGFIGGGRVTRIMLNGLSNRSTEINSLIVADPESANALSLQELYPELNILADSNMQAATQDWIFIAVHPPQVMVVLEEVREHIRPESVVFSLAPVITIAEISAKLNGHTNIIRMIPNAASYMNMGYNPISFAPGMERETQFEILELLELLGECPVVEEEKLEAYAIITAMGPTYLWPQTQQLHQLGVQFGLTVEEATVGTKAMLQGMIDLQYKTTLDYEALIDLIPVKPLNEKVENLCRDYQAVLTGLHNKLKRLV